MSKEVIEIDEKGQWSNRKKGNRYEQFIEKEIHAVCIKLIQ